MRWAIGVEYDGTAYHGWQYQPHAPSVQEQVERALSGVAAQPLRVVCCGRTDTGVHALGQVVHFDSAAERNPRSWLFGGNAALPEDISLRWAVPVSDDFHARYRAFQRDYVYLIHNHACRSALFARRATNCHLPLDAERMQQAAQALVGEHDFSAFRAAACQAKSPVRRVEHVNVYRRHDFVLISVRANAFLHHMVRNIAGSLIQVGLGRQTPEWLGRRLAEGDRRQSGATAPPQGLYFLGPRYPQEFGIPAVEENSLLRQLMRAD